MRMERWDLEKVIYQYESTKIRLSNIDHVYLEVGQRAENSFKRFQVLRDIFWNLNRYTRTWYQTISVRYYTTFITNNNLSDKTRISNNMFHHNFNLKTSIITFCIKCMLQVASSYHAVFAFNDNLYSKKLKKKLRAWNNKVWYLYIKCFFKFIKKLLFQ